MDRGFDPRTQIKTGPVYDANAGTITWTVRDKTADELAAEKTKAVNSIISDPTREALVDMMFDVEKRLSVLEGTVAPTRDQVRAKVGAAIRARLP